MTTKTKTQTTPQPDSEPDHGAIVVDLPNGAFVPGLAVPLGIKQLVVDGGDLYAHLYAVRTDDRLFVKKFAWPGGGEDPWEEIETTTLFEQ